MAVTIAQRMTRFLKRNGGVCPGDLKDLYRAYRRGDDEAGEKLLAQVEDDDDREQDAFDRMDAEVLNFSDEPIRFMTSGCSEPVTPAFTFPPLAFDFVSDGSPIESDSEPSESSDSSGVEGDQEASDGGSGAGDSEAGSGVHDGREGIASDGGSEPGGQEAVTDEVRRGNGGHYDFRSGKSE